MKNEITINISTEAAELIKTALKAYSRQLADQVDEIRKSLTDLPTAEELGALAYLIDDAHIAETKAEADKLSETVHEADMLANDIGCELVMTSHR